MNTLEQCLSMMAVKLDEAKMAEWAEKIKSNPDFSSAPGAVVELVSSYMVLRSEVTKYILKNMLSGGMPKDPQMALKIMYFGSISHQLALTISGK